MFVDYTKSSLWATILLTSFSFTECAGESRPTVALERVFREIFLTRGAVLTLGVHEAHQSCNSFAITAYKCEK